MIEKKKPLSNVFICTMFQTGISYPDLVPINPAPRFPLSKIMTPPHDDDDDDDDGRT